MYVCMYGLLLKRDMSLFTAAEGEREREQLYLKHIIMNIYL
jgi:hypothetical protein